MGCRIESISELAHNYSQEKLTKKDRSMTEQSFIITIYLFV